MTAIVLLTKNEEHTIGSLIDNLKSFLKQTPDLNAKLFLCDDSTDQTADIAKQKGVEIIKGKNCGLGWSYYFALHFVVNLNIFKNIITIDGDGQTDLSELCHFYKELNKGYDLIVGSRFLQKQSISYPYPKINSFGAKVLALIITISTLQKFTDSHGGLRVMKSSVAKKLNFLGAYSYVQETIMTAKEQGFKIKEVPSKWHKRKYGKSRVLHSKWKYIKAMSLPLFLRMRTHYLFLIMALILSFLFYDFSYIWLIIPFGLSEIYKIRTSKKNLKEIRKWADNG